MYRNMLSMKVNYLIYFKRLAYVSEGCTWKWATLLLPSEWYKFKNCFHGNKLTHFSSLCHWYQDVMHKNKSSHVTHVCDSGSEMLFMISYLASLLCVILIPKWHPWTLATWHSFITWYMYHNVFYENMLPCICSLYDIGFKVLSMKINFLASFKHVT